MYALTSKMPVEALGSFRLHWNACPPYLLTSAYSDPDCGAAFVAAEDEYVLGWADGCSQTNPSNDAVMPTVSPICS